MCNYLFYFVFRRKVGILFPTLCPDFGGGKQGLDVCSRDWDVD